VLEGKAAGAVRVHGLRKAGAPYLAELGATVHRLMGWFVELHLQAQIYIKMARAKFLAQATGRLITGIGIGSPITRGAKMTTKAFEIIGSKK
jgi:hypothetical protein